MNWAACLEFFKLYLSLVYCIASIGISSSTQRGTWKQFPSRMQQTTSIATWLHSQVFPTKMVSTLGTTPMSLGVLHPLHRVCFRYIHTTGFKVDLVSGNSFPSSIIVRRAFPQASTPQTRSATDWMNILLLFWFRDVLRERLFGCIGWTTEQMGKRSRYDGAFGAFRHGGLNSSTKIIKKTKSEFSHSSWTIYRREPLADFRYSRRVFSNSVSRAVNHTNVSARTFWIDSRTFESPFVGTKRLMIIIACLVRIEMPYTSILGGGLLSYIPAASRYLSQVSCIPIIKSHSQTTRGISAREC